MTERGILFSAPMVRALLDGSKTQTRRVCKPQPFDRSYSKHDHRMGYASGRAADGDEIDGFFAYSTSSGGQWKLKCPYGQPGDRLWVRETHGEVYDYCDHPEMPGAPTERWHIEWKYRADGEPDRPHLEGAWTGWKPSIHMPRRASRILLEITGVRVERLQDISEADAIAEGCSGYRPDDDPFRDVEPRDEYRELWGSINGAGSWDANPWVWVVEFKRAQP